MKMSESVKPISYFKAHASEIILKARQGQKTIIITQNGEAKVVVQDICIYEQTLESLALLKILAQSKESLKKGKVKPLKKAFRDIRQKIAKKIKNQSHQ